MGPREKKHIYACLASAQRVADAYTKAFDGKPKDDALIYVDVTVAAAGTVTVYLECSPDDGVTWHRDATNLATAALGAVASTVTALKGPFGSKCRIYADVSAGGDLTFSVDLELCRRGA
jgi:hypothetical protein